MNDYEKLELADLFIAEESRSKLYEKVKEFISIQRATDRSRILSLVGPLMGGDLAVDKRISDQILNG